MDNVKKYIKHLTEGWLSSGLKAGDTVLIHSSIKRTLRTALKQGVRIKPVHILDSFIDAVGPEGTLIFPLFNFDFPETKHFDFKKTPSQMGALTECSRTYPGSIRTGHPIYSFSVIGKHAHKFRGVDNYSGYGKDSPFALLRELNGKIAALDLDEQNCMTFYHHVEESNAVNYRFFKQFAGTYIDETGLSSSREYSLFVRDLDKGVLTHVNPTGELMWQHGLYKGSRPLVANGLRIVDANLMFDFVSNIIKSGNALGNLYITGEYDGRK